MRKTKPRAKNGKPIQSATTLTKQLADTRKELRRVRQERDDYRRILDARLKHETLQKREQYEEDMKHTISEPPLREMIQSLFK